MMHSYNANKVENVKAQVVLILVVMDDALVRKTWVMLCLSAL